MVRKEFKEINDQLRILEKRGLLINNEDSARKYLLTNNYYNIINGYSKYFQQEPSGNSDQYIQGASFDEVCHLYFFDKEIKQTMFNAILDVEHHLKSIFAFRFAEAFKDKRFAYLDINCYDEDQVLSVGYIISRISKIINNKNKKNKKSKKRDNAIYHYISDYDDVPIWVIVDFLDFGILESMIRCVDTSIKNKIATDCISFIKDNQPDFDSIFPPETMISFIKIFMKLETFVHTIIDYWNSTAVLTQHSSVHFMNNMILQIPILEEKSILRLSAYNVF